MQKLLLGLIMSCVFAVSAFAADLSIPPQVKHVSTTRNTCAAIAISTDARKDAYGFQYLKNSCAGAENDAKRFCEERFAQHGFSGGRCAVKSSTGYVIGVYCVDRGRAHAGIGVGLDPLSAADDALRQVQGFSSRRCVFQQMRHGSIEKNVIEERVWVASIRCGSRDHAVRSKGAIAAINAVLKNCDSDAGSCHINAFEQQ